MKITQLRHFMPLAGPGQREPVHGDESPFRVSLGFTPAWFCRHLGLDFSRRWHQDPVYRYESMLCMKQYLHKLFPDMEAFQTKKNPWGAEQSCATISGVYGVCPVGAVYGLPVQFGKEVWPDTTRHFSKEELSRLKPIRLSENAFVQELLTQMDVIQQQYGCIDGYLHYQGILNSAFRLMGQEIFLEMLEDPPFVRFLFDHIYQTTLELCRLVQKRQAESGFESSVFTMANCVANMISTKLYEEFLLPYEMQMEQEFQSYGVHTCNWDVTRFIPPLQKLTRLGYLDMGMMSDLKRVREAFPRTRLAVLYHPNDIGRKPLEQVEKDFVRIRQEAAPCDLLLVDIGPELPMERLFAVTGLALRMEREALLGSGVVCQEM